MRHWLLLALLMLVSTSLVAEQRSFDPIDGDAEPRSLRPAERQQVEDWLQELAAAWNTPMLGDFLHPDFPQRQRLLAALEDDVPPDARLRILSVGPVQVLDQRREPGRLNRTLRVGLRLQVEGPADDGGLERRESRQNLVLEWTRKVPTNSGR